MLYAGFTAPLDYDICGYKPQQLESAYGLSANIAAGDNGSGVKLAIVDAYDSPTLLKDAQQYFNTNDPSIPLTNSQFTNDKPSSVGNEAECAASGWYAEQALDVESSHAMAPGAHIVFVGANDCFDSSLLAAVNTAIRREILRFRLHDNSAIVDTTTANKPRITTSIRMNC